jgi:hypothetical protein
MAEEKTMSQIATQEGSAGDASNPIRPVPDRISDALLKRATDGDMSCLPEIREVRRSLSRLESQNPGGENQPQVMTAAN